MLLCYVKPIIRNKVDVAVVELVYLFYLKSKTWEKAGECK